MISPAPQSVIEGCASMLFHDPVAVCLRRKEKTENNHATTCRHQYTLSVAHQKREVNKDTRCAVQWLDEGKPIIQRDGQHTVPLSCPVLCG